MPHVYTTWHTIVTGPLQTQACLVSGGSWSSWSHRSAVCPLAYEHTLALWHRLAYDLILCFKIYDTRCGFFSLSNSPATTSKEGRKEGNVLFNDALNIFYLRLYGIGHMVKNHSDSERGNLLPPHGLLFP